MKLGLFPFDADESKHISRRLASWSCVRNVDSRCAVFVCRNSDVTHHGLDVCICIILVRVCHALRYRTVLNGAGNKAILRITSSSDDGKLRRVRRRPSGSRYWHLNDGCYHGAAERVLLALST